jgi:hypothetical protein
VTTAIDTKILLDILIPDPSFQNTSKEALEKALSRGRLLVGEIVYGDAKFPEDSLDSR